MLIADLVHKEPILRVAPYIQEILGESWKGQHIGVFKSNLIIPQVRWAEQNNDNLSKDYIHIPVKCPICGSSVEIRKDNDTEVLFCTNDDCKGKLLGKLSHAVSRDALNIDGLSEATLDKLIDLGLLDSVRDIYHLSEHQSELESLDGFGEKSVKKLLNSIEKSRNTSLERFLVSLSIPLLGKSASMMVADAVDYEFGEFMRVMTLVGADVFKNIPGVGDSLIASMNSYFNKYCAVIFDLSKEFTFETPKSILSEIRHDLDNKTFVITGSLEHYPNRDALKSVIESHGGAVVGSVSSKTSYLINNDINSTSSKNKKAKSLNIPIITEEDFIKLIGGTENI